MINALRKSDVNILVVGDLMIDHYLWGSCERISPEAPVQVVDIKKETTTLGGAGNVINNLVSLGANVSVASVIGKDDIANEMLEILEDLDVVTKNIIKQEERKTSKKSRILASNQQIVRYDKESKEDISKQSEEKLLKSIKNDIKNFDAVILSDYGKGVLTDSFTKELISLANRYEKKVFVDPKGKDYSKYTKAYLLTPNKKEATLATGVEITDEESLKKALLKLKEICDVKIPLITLSEDGIAILEDDVKRFPTVAKEVFDVTGAGDTVIASLAFAIANGFDIDKACVFANLAAGVVVGKIGSATVTLDEIEEYESSLRKSEADDHIKSFEEIANIVENAKKRGKTIVFTNGCFDILHVGHVKYLQIAKSFGDVLIVGLNSDQSIKRLKGEDRPVNTLQDRAYILASLEVVDYVVPFESDTPLELIKMIKPDILVKGGDYKGKKVVGTEFAGELRLVDFVDGKSTTNIISKIKEGSIC